MIDTPTIDWAALAPELVLLTAAAIAMLFAVLVPKRLEKQLAAIVCALGFVGALIAAGVLYNHSADGHAVIAGAIQRDQLAALAQMIIAGAGLLCVAVAYSGRGSWRHAGEFFALLASAGAGMIFLVAANNLMTLFLGLEWFSISLYILCAVDVDVVSSLEAGLKYLIVGSFGSAVLLFGSALVYGTTGHLDFSGIASAGHTSDPLFIAGLAMIIAGLGFKASAAPFHMWTPDVYEGAPTGVTAFMSSATKVAALVLMLRVLTPRSRSAPSCGPSPSPSSPSPRSPSGTSPRSSSGASNACSPTRRSRTPASCSSRSPRGMRSADARSCTT